MVHNPQFWGSGMPKPCARARNPQFQSADMRLPWAWAAILDSAVPTALNLRFGRKNEIMRMISSFWNISKSGATAASAHSLTFYASPPRDSIAIPTSLMRGDFGSSETLYFCHFVRCNEPFTGYPRTKPKRNKGSLTRGRTSAAAGSRRKARYHKFQYSPEIYTFPGFISEPLSPLTSLWAPVCLASGCPHASSDADLPRSLGSRHVSKD